MRSAFTAFLILVIAGCSDLIAPDLTRINRTYHLTGCLVAGGPVAPPCLEYSSGSHHDTADSGRVELRPDKTVTWVLWSTIDVNPCYLSGTPCHQVAVVRDSTEGTYDVQNDVVMLSLHREGHPDEQRQASAEEWSALGPAVLSVSLSTVQPNSGRFTP